MNADIVFCSAAALVCLLYAIVSSVELLRMRQHTAETTGTIVDIARLPNPHAKTHLNAHWATVGYSVDGHPLISENRVQVAKTALVGSPVRIRYIKTQPTHLCQTSPQRSLVALALAIVFALLALLLH